MMIAYSANTAWECKFGIRNTKNIVGAQRCYVGHQFNVVILLFWLNLLLKLLFKTENNSTQFEKLEKCTCM